MGKGKGKEKRTGEKETSVVREQGREEGRKEEAPLFLAVSC